MSISIYDPTLWDKKIPANVLGGLNRSKTARRLQGKFLPKDEFAASLVTPDPNHGKAGGRKTLEKYGRQYFSQLAKRKTNRS